MTIDLGGTTRQIDVPEILDRKVREWAEEEGLDVHAVQLACYEAGVQALDTWSEYGIRQIARDWMADAEAAKFHKEKGKKQ